jgi:heat shock protein HslJ
MRGASLAAWGALVAVPAPAHTPEDGYRAQGNEPSWSLTIAKGRMTYTEANKRSVDVATPTPEDDEGILYYTAPGLQVSVMPVACSDRATGRRYEHSVFVDAGRDNRSGCGGALLSPDSLDGTSWKFIEIAGETTELTGDLLRDDRYAIDFGADRFSGYTGCNLIRGRYQVREGMMTIDEVGSTGGGCGEPATRRERRAWQILAAPMRVSRPSPEIMVLTGKLGSLKLKRSDD